MTDEKQPVVTAKDWAAAKRFMGETGYDDEDTLLVAQLCAAARAEGERAGYEKGFGDGVEAARPRS